MEYAAIAVSGLQNKPMLWMKLFFPSLLKPTNRNILCMNQALAPSLTGATNHTCTTDQSKLRNVHRRVALHCTQAVLGLSPESHGSRGRVGLVSVKNSFLFCNCNPGVHSLLGCVFHRETAELVLPCLRQGAAGHHPPPALGVCSPGWGLPSLQRAHSTLKRNLWFSHRRGI